LRGRAGETLGTDAVMELLRGYARDKQDPGFASD
jgi:hypothetical protein